MKKNYHPKYIELKSYKIWKKNQFFITNFDLTKKNYCIILPPPNITGGLHIGHAFQQSIIDILIRYHRMKGKNTLLQLGIDHAGIATQNILENQLKNQENKTRFDYGKSEFLRKAWKWKNKSEKLIIQQIQRLGCIADFDRLRFTMDDHASKAIRKIFLKLYENKLIYKKNRLIYWDTKLHTVVSDLEVKHCEKNSKIWYLKYYLDNCSKTQGLNFLEVATTRPETIFGDVAIAVNPKDNRYQNLIGKYVIIPLLNRAIPIIQDVNVKIEFGTGCLKITPAHDFNDFNICKKHKLKMINIFTFSGKLRKFPEVFDYQGNIIKDSKIDIPEEFHDIKKNKLRILVVNKLKSLGYITKIESKKIKFPIADRSNVILEPMITNQWYLKVKSLANTAITAVKEGNIQFIPKQYENMYLSWMSNIEDWCISRQIWWGHKIPIWYDNNQKPYAGNNEYEIRKKFKIKSDATLVQDENVLDTWFSSAVWSFVSLGWPNKSKFFDMFHPTNVIVSGFDIIYFWIARMIMLTMYVIKDNTGKPHVPFSKIYITGLIRDQYGKKMSKSEGNVIDPIDIIDGITLSDLLKKRTKDVYDLNLKQKIINSTKKEFPHGIPECGADALRFNMARIASNSRNINIKINQIIGCKNFCNKLWHASKFIFINTENKKINFDTDKIYFSPLDQWILHKYNEILILHKKYLDNFRFDLSADNLYQFVWHEFCDWYLEISKIIFKENIILYLESTYYTLINILKNLLKMLHPFVPFITEEIWGNFQKIFGNTKKNIIMFEYFPKKINLYLKNENIYQLVEWTKNIIIAIRKLKIDMKIPQKKLMHAHLINCSQQEINFIKQHMNMFCKIFYLKSINFNLNNIKKNLNLKSKLIKNVKLYLE
ncbi:MAG: valine--tRNA ligase [Wigglesworthia glossinidia]|nr:valine--tRNA ligase [Wigglesworthia glossinidia]